MYGLTYSSKASATITLGEIQDILEVARSHNQEKNITGCLIFHKGKFIQILEGYERDVHWLFGKLKNDIRHSELAILWEGASTKRVFPNWNMAYHGLQARATDSEIKLFEKNLLLLSEVMEKPNAAVQLFWKRVNSLVDSKDTKV